MPCTHPCQAGSSCRRAQRSQTTRTPSLTAPSLTCRTAEAETAEQRQGQQQGQQQQQPPPAPPSHAMGSQQEPPPGMQLAVCAVGLAALPVVAWSEWVLKSTGKSAAAGSQPQGVVLLLLRLASPNRPACLSIATPAWPSCTGKLSSALLCFHSWPLCRLRAASRPWWAAGGSRGSLVPGCGRRGAVEPGAQAGHGAR